MAKNEEQKQQDPTVAPVQPKATVIDLDDQARSFGQLLASGPKRMISLAPAGKNEPQMVPVIVNGYRYEVARGFDVEVPEVVAQILRDAGYR